MIKKISSQTEYLKAIDELLEHDRLYYQEASPKITDYEYDLLTKEVELFEKEHPNLISDKSPTLRVGEALTEGFAKGKHIQPMLSLANTYSDEEIVAFMERVERLLGNKKASYCTELKMDGTAISVRYEKGKLTRALTRGNGKEGDDVTSNMKTIRSLPLELKGDVPDLLEVRGEVFMHKMTFQKLNQEREEAGLEPWANPRNAAAGSLKLLDPKIARERRLDVVFYGVAHAEKIFQSQHDVHLGLKKWGLSTSLEKHFAKAHSIKEIMAFAERILKEREKLSFEIDGIVIKVDELKYHEDLGVTGKSPRSAVAYKFAPEQAETKINAITVQVGRTGVLTPVAELEPVFLAGSKISRATLHNEDEIKRKDIRINDTVLIEKGGDVIPKVVEVDLSKRDPSAKKWHMPSKCPSCGSSVHKEEGEVAYRCVSPTCPAQNLRKIIFFASKQAMDIEHLGEKVVELLVDEGLIKTAADLYQLTHEDLQGLEGFKEKSIQNLLTSIEESKTRALSKFIMALGIPFVGKETAEILADKAGALQKLVAFSYEDLIDTYGIGEKVAEAIVSYFNDPHNIEEINKMLNRGVHPKVEEKKEIKGHSFQGKTFVITGTLETYSRDEAKELIKERGGKVSSSVSKKTDYVLVGDDPGSKYDKAKALKVPIMHEKEFLEEL